jgi:hypothetical protein
MLNQKVLSLLSLMQKIMSYLHNGWSVNLLAIENCIFSICSIEHNMRPILQTVCTHPLIDIIEYPPHLHTSALRYN